MRLLSLFTLLLLFSSCGGDLLLSANEKKAQDEVVKFYGGICRYSKGFEYTSGKKEEYFELSFSKSELLNHYADKIEMPATNIAYLFYSNLGSDQKKYTHIRVKINTDKGGDYEQSFPVKDIQEIMRFTPYVPLIESLILKKDFATLWATFDEKMQAELNEDIIRAFFHPGDSVYGPIQNLQFQGYQFTEAEIDSRPMVHLVCVAQRDKDNTPLSLHFDRKTRKLMGMNEQY